MPAPSLCTITGTLRKANGAVWPNGQLTISRAASTSQVLGGTSVIITADASGAVSFDLVQGSIVTISGAFVIGKDAGVDYDFSRGLRIFVPVQSSATLEALKTIEDELAAISAPTTDAIEVQEAGVSLGSFTALNFATGATVTDAGGGVADVDITGGGGGSVSSVFGRTGVVVAATNDYTFAQIDKTTSSLADLTTRSAADLSSGTLAAARGGAGTINGLLKANGSGVVSAAVSGTDYEVPLTFSTGLTRSTDTITVDTSVIATRSYADSLVVGLLDDRGNYDASGNVFPSSGGSGSAGAILKGDLWTVSVAGTLGGTAVTSGDLVRALVDTPGQTASNWAVSETNIGYTALNASLSDGQIYIGNSSNVGTARTLSGDVTVSNTGVTAIGSAKVTNAMLAGSIDLATKVTGDLPFANFVQAGSAGFVGATGAGDYSHRTPTQVTAALDAFVGDSGSGGTKGLVPAPTTGDATKYLKGDGTWATVSGGGSPGGSDTQLQYNSGGSFAGISGATSNGTSVTFGSGNLIATSPALTTPAITTSATVTRDSLGTTTAAGVELTNTTAAAAGTQQVSPATIWTGQGWKTTATAASQAVNFQAYVLPVQGAANPTATWTLQSQINAGGYTTRAQVDSAGVLTLPSSGSYVLVDTVSGGASIIRWGSATGRGMIAANNGIGFTNASGNNSLSNQSGGVHWTLSRDAMFGWSNTANNAGQTQQTFVRSPAAAEFTFGSTDAASPVAQTQSVQNVVAGTTNTAGATWTRDASRGTGTGAGGRHVWRTAPAGSSGSSQNALVEACAIESSGTFKLKALAFSALPTAIADGEMFYCSDGAVTSGADNTLTSGGSGALAIRINGVWRAFNAQN